MVDAVVENGDDDALSRDALAPRRLHVHVEPAPRAVVQVPLRVEHGIAAAPRVEDVLPFGHRVWVALLLLLLLVEDGVPKRPLKIASKILNCSALLGLVRLNRFIDWM